MNKSPNYLFFLAAFLLAILFFMPDGYVSKSLKARSFKNANEFVLASESVSKKNEKREIFENLDLEAKAVYVYDLKNEREIFSKKAESVLPLASLAKLMTGFLAKELLPEDSFIKISEKAVRQKGDEGLAAGETWLTRDLIDFMLVSSSNDAAFALAEETVRQIKKENQADGIDQISRDFAELMNGKTKELDLGHTVFSNPTGLDLSADTAGAAGSAKDAVFLIKNIIERYPYFLDVTRNESLKFYPISAEGKSVPRPSVNTNKGLFNIFQLVGGKTGFTDLSGGNLAVVVDAGLNHPVAIVVLGSSGEGRFKDVENISRALFR